MGRQVIDNQPIREDEYMEIDLLQLTRDFVHLLLKFWWIVLLCIVIGIVSIGFFSYAHYVPMYSSTATFTVGTGDENGGSYNFNYSISTAEQISKTFPYILNSSYFKSVLLEKLDKNVLNGTISSSTVEKSNVVTMSVESSSPEDALAILNASLEVYPKTAQYVLGNLQFHMIDAPKLSQLPANKPSLRHIVVVGGFGGALVCTMIIAVLALMRKTIKTPDEMKEITSLKCISTIPLVKMKARKKKQSRKISVLDQRANERFVESVRALQIRMERELKKEDGKVLMLTSTFSEEGKSTLAVNLAEMLASTGKKVLLVDGDLRKQDLSRILECDTADSITACVHKDNNALKIQKIEDKKFWFVGGTKSETHTAEILSNSRMEEFFLDMRNKMDYILIDTPPSGEFQDAFLLQSYADAILYVIRYDFAPKRKILETLFFLNSENIPFLGYVFTMLPQGMNQHEYGLYGYGKYGYGYDVKKVRSYKEEEML